MAAVGMKSPGADAAPRLLTVAVMCSLGLIDSGALGAPAGAAPDLQSMVRALADWNAGAQARVASLSALAPPGMARSARAATTTIRAVTSCADAGSGSLRSVVAASASGDIVDMSLLNCSPIVLASSITIGVGSLTIQGKTQQTLVIDPDYASLIFGHTGTGTLSISDMTLRRGKNGDGGCIFSNGSVALTRVTLNYCKAVGYQNYALGGGVVALGNLTLASSTLRKNYAYDLSGTRKACGAGAYVVGNLVVSNSTISYNSADSSAGAAGGGLCVAGNATIGSSTIKHNTAIQVLGTSAFGGGLFAAGNVDATASTFDDNNASVGGAILDGQAGTASVVTLTNSTVALNDAAFAGGIAAFGPLHLNNSTVARNLAGGNEGGGGVFVYAATGNVFESALVASNYASQGCTQKCAPTNVAADLSSLGTGVTIAGASNLVTSAGSGITLPNDTLTGDPLLASFLENNGGPTQTLGLGAGSPAIDHGNNVRDLSSDQRGAPFCRKVGSKPDIGALEVQPAGTGCGLIFANGFEAAP